MLSYLKYHFNPISILQKLQRSLKHISILQIKEKQDNYEKCPKKKGEPRPPSRKSQLHEKKKNMDTPNFPKTTTPINLYSEKCHINGSSYLFN